MFHKLGVLSRLARGHVHERGCPFHASRTFSADGAPNGVLDRCRRRTGEIVAQAATFLTRHSAMPPSAAPDGWSESTHKPGFLVPIRGPICRKPQFLRAKRMRGGLAYRREHEGALWREAGHGRLAPALRQHIRLARERTSTQGLPLFCARGQATSEDIVLRVHIGICHLLLCCLAQAQFSIRQVEGSCLKVQRSKPHSS